MSAAHRHVVMMSGGIGSWATARDVIKEHGADHTVLLFADTKAEHPDLYRFLDDAAVQLGVPITRVTDGRTPWQVFRDVRRIGNSQIAPCSHLLKQVPCRTWMKTHTTPDTATIYVGIDWSEIHRLPDIEQKWAPWPVRAPLCDPPYVDKDALIAEASAAGIRPPALYAMGFPHNNCGGACVRAGQGQWAHLLQVDPDRFAAEEAEENALRAHLDKDVAILRDRRGGITRPLPLTVLRHRVTSGQATHGALALDVDDWGGCGCFTDTPEDPMPTAPVRPLAVVPQRPQTAWTADELMAVSFPDPTWAVPGIIAEGVNLLAGPPKVGKSWLSLGLGLSIAAGTAAFGTIPVDPGPVLYLALEDTPRRLQSRMRRVLAGQRAPAALTLDIHCPPLPAGGDFYIAEWLDAHPGARLVVIDVFAKVRGKPADGTSSAYEADYAAVGKAKTLADTYGVAVLLVHHVRKAGSEDFLQTVSGTNGLAGAADAVLVLERARAKADGVLHVTGRDVDETDYALSFDPEAGAWTLLDGPAEDHLMQTTRALIARFVRDYPGKTPARIAEALQLNPSTVRQTCKRMADDGQLHAEPGGAYFPPQTSDSSDAHEVSHLSLRHSTASDQGEDQ